MRVIGAAVATGETTNRFSPLKIMKTIKRSILTALLAAFPLGYAGQLDLEKDELKFGFIKLTDCAPIVIAKEMGYFEDEGLQVEVTAQPNWKQLLDNVINGELDGAHMLSGQPIAATIGFWNQGAYRYSLYTRSQWQRDHRIE